MVASWAGLNIQERARDKTEENFFLVSQAAIDMNSGLTLEGGVALVTGAAKRLGRHLPLHLAGEGADIGVHYGKSETEAHALVEEIERQGRHAAAFSADFTNVQAIACFDQAGNRPLRATRYPNQQRGQFSA